MNEADKTRSFAVCLGSHRQAATWRREVLTSREVLNKLQTPKRTGETVAQYHKMEKPERDKIKDGPGFFAGTLKGTRRKKNEVVSRSIITIDADKLKP